MLGRCFVFAIVLLLSFTPAKVMGDEGQSPVGSQQSSDNSQDSSFGELLEFLGQWETGDGTWVDPTDLDWLLTPEEESKDEQEKNP
jgi:hypothetical protein